VSWRFRRRLRIARGLYLNLGKRGASVSLGVRGAHVTFCRRGKRATIGLPGSGLSYEPYHERVTPQPAAGIIVASYKLSDEGKHWRSHIQPELTPLEKAVQNWMADRVAVPNWEIPL
jgi:hypothetical protein